MFSEKEFNLLAMLKANSFLKRESFENEQAFDDACQIAMEMFNSGVINSPSKRPYQINNSGRGATYVIMGKFELSSGAREALAFASYDAYQNAQPRESKWNLSNRLAVWAIVATLLSIAIMIFIT